MRIARITTDSGPQFAEFDAGVGWRILDGSFEQGFTRSGRVAPRDSELLAPAEPRVVIGMAHNALPEGLEQPPQAFLKSARTVIGPHQPIMLDSRAGTTQVETELVLVIGRHCRNLTTENALDSVFGFTIGNDVTAIDQVALDGLFTQVKHGDGYTPIGPWIETDLADVDNLEMRVFIDNTLVATGSTSGLAALVREQLVYITRHLSLGPGDIVLGGSPGTFFRVQPGQQVRLEIDGLGALHNPVHSLVIETDPGNADSGAGILKGDSHAAEF